MTCEHVTERLLETAITDWAELQPHLESCPRCRALAERITEDQAHLVDTVEDYMNAPLPGLPEAAPVRPAWGWWIPGAGLMAAAAAVFALALVPGEEVAPSPEGEALFQMAAAPPVLYAAEDATARFFDAVGEPVRLEEGAARSAVDAALRDALNTRAAAMGEAEKALQEAAAHEDPQVGMIALHDLGEVYVAMGTAIRELPHPPYLSEKQSEIYQLALDDKGYASEAKAIDAWERARTIALEAGFEPEAAALQGRIDALRASWEIAVPAPSEADISRVAGELREVLEGCAVPLEEGLVGRLERGLRELAGPMGGEDTPEGIARRLDGLREMRLEAREACLELRVARMEGLLAGRGEDCLSEDSLSEVGAVVEQAQVWLDAPGEKGEPGMYTDIDQFFSAYEVAVDEALENCEP